ncbi:hypothetical protein MMC24_003480 [Lignoscripta atroalba]|nr:hypothetical protein [Lignoscripta atroalba]
MKYLSLLALFGGIVGVTAVAAPFVRLPLEASNAGVSTRQVRVIELPDGKIGYPVKREDSLNVAARSEGQADSSTCCDSYLVDCDVKANSAPIEKRETEPASPPVEKREVKEANGKCDKDMVECRDHYPSTWTRSALL